MLPTPYARPSKSLARREPVSLLAEVQSDVLCLQIPLRRHPAPRHLAPRASLPRASLHTTTTSTPAHATSPPLPRLRPVDPYLATLFAHSPLRATSRSTPQHSVRQLRSPAHPGVS
ncbi:hypothetical protein PMIN06_004965 [Paraphaeosphaeria minitans]